MTFQTKRKFLQAAVVVLVLGLFAVAALYYFSRYDTLNRENLRDLIAGFGVWAPAIYFLTWLVSSLVPFLGPVLTAAGGLLFGVWWGTTYTVLFGTVVALLPLGLARWLGRRWVIAQLDDTRLQSLYEATARRSSLIFVILLRLVPLVPWEIQNYLVGLTKIDVGAFVLGTLVGMVPGTLAYTLLGSAIVAPGSWEFFVAVGLVIITKVIVPAAGGTYLYKQAQAGEV
ncbi:MAG: TVP38/TMEM64 family protein [Anaerolineales bacterium]